MLDICLYTDIPEDEREDIVALESYEVKLDRLFNTYAAIMEAAELNIREAELKCFEESGDMDDLEEYYKEAEEKTAEQSKGIFQKIKEGIVSFFRKISSFLFGKKNKVSDEGEAEAPAGLLGFAQKIINAFKSGFGKLKNALVNHKVGAGVVAAGGVAVAAFAFINRDAIKNITESGKKERISKKAGKEAGEGLAQAAKDIADACDQVDASKPDEETKKLFGRLRTIGSCIQSAGSTLLDFCVGAKSAIKDKFSKDGEEETTNGGNNNPPGVQKEGEDLTKLSNRQVNKRIKDDAKSAENRHKEEYKKYKEKQKAKNEGVMSYKEWMQHNKDMGFIGNEVGNQRFKDREKDRNSTTVRDTGTVKKDSNKKSLIKFKSITADQLYQVINDRAKKGDETAITAIKDFDKDFDKDHYGKYRNKDDNFKKRYLKSKTSKLFVYETEEDDIFDDGLFSESFDDDFDSLLDGMFEESEEEDDEDNFVEESEDDFWNNNADSFFEEAEEIVNLLNTLFIGESSNGEDE